MPKELKMQIRSFDHHRGRDYDEFRRVFTENADVMNVQPTEVDSHISKLLNVGKDPETGLFLTAWDAPSDDPMNHLLGFAILKRGTTESDRHVAQMRLTVDETQQSKGVGTSLVRSLLEESRSLGIHRIEVLNYETSVADRHWLEGMGFQSEGRLKNCVNVDGKIIDAFLLAYIF